MNKNLKAAGLILSAGLSSRMKEFKPLMKIGEKNSLEILIDNMNIAGIEDIYVVVGYNADIIVEALKDKNVKTVLNEDYETGMFSSVQAGIRAVADAGYDCVLMTPVDIPLIPPYIFTATAERFEKNRDCFTVPCFEGKKGHPLCIPSMYFDEIIASKGENGLKSVTSKHEDKMLKFETHCKSIVMDMDTQEAYKELVSYFNANRYPDEEKCYRILERMETPSHVIRHCEAVTRTGVALAEALNHHGHSFSIPLIRAAGLLHDVLRVRRMHWEEGANLALLYGYPEVADIIRAHMNYIHPLPVRSITEKDIICLSDKLRQEDRLVTLETRLEPVKIRWKDDPEAIKVIETKIAAAGAVMRYIEEVIDENVYDLLRKLDELLAEEEGRKPRGRRLILIRHGETQKHKEKIFMGQTDVPLNVEGREQCTHVGLEMQHFDIDAENIYCSDLKRAVESARIIGRIMGDKYGIVEVPEFRELNLGSWDGMYISEVKEKYPEEYASRGKDILNFKIDDTAESFVELEKRVKGKLLELIDATDGDVCIVSHSGALRVMKCIIQNRPLKDIAKMKFDRGTYEIIELPGEN